MLTQSEALNILATYYPCARPEPGQQGYNMVRADRYEDPHSFQDIVSALTAGFPSSLFDSADYVEIRFTQGTIQLYTGRYIPDAEGVAKVTFIDSVAYSTDIKS